jgi:hypothetical protein
MGWKNPNFGKKVSNLCGNAYSAATTVNTQAPLSTYGVASEELQVFNRLNDDRLNCGFGSLRQNKNLDTAAVNHLNWIYDNNYSISHYEDLRYSSGPNTGQLTIGYTGNSVGARATFAGYKFEFIGETIASISASGSQSINQLRQLYSAPYHAVGLFSRARDVGISSTNATHKNSILEVTFGYITADGPQLLASDAVSTYPCQGTQDTATALTDESPNPVPGRDLAVLPIGQPIIIVARIGNTIVISNASITQVSNSLPLKLLPTKTSSNDEAQHLMSNEAFVMPDKPLQKNSLYQVNIAGTNNNIPFTKSFTFTTGSK